jgi:hypothetical protein
MTLTACPTCLPAKPSLNASARAWNGSSPRTGSSATLWIASGFFSATASISTPPSADAMSVLVLRARSIVIAR